MADGLPLKSSLWGIWFKRSRLAVSEIPKWERRYDLTGLELSTTTEAVSTPTLETG